VTNGSGTATDALIIGAPEGVFSGSTGTVVNFGTVLGGSTGVELKPTSESSPAQPASR
jgi:hypothetical protein